MSIREQKRGINYKKKIWWIKHIFYVTINYIYNAIFDAG